MREIKFRAWDKDRKCFLPCIVGNTDINDDKWICPLTYCEVNGVYNWYHNDTCEIMQYTGLKDKNGKEIYEGDIVRYTNFIEEIYNEEIGVCVFEQDECNFCLQRTTINKENYPVPTTIHTIYLISNVTYANDVSYEVIGNIYDNPELLKGGSHE